MEDGDIAVIPGASVCLRNHDTEFPFRQDSDYLYLTGHREPDGILVLAKGVQDLPEELLFVLPRDPDRETWTGRRLGPEGARERLGFGAADSVERASERLTHAIQHARRLWYRLGASSELDGLVMDAIQGAREKLRQGLAAPEAILDPDRVLHELRMFKAPEELECMRRACAISAEAHVLAMAQAGPGIGEWELEGLIDGCFRRRGADGWAYRSIVAGGDNACVLHYMSNAAPLRAGDMLLIDAGAEVDGYAADITRSFPVDGVFSPAQRAVYEWVLAAQEAAIECCRPGEAWNLGHEEAVRVLAAGLCDLGVLEDPVERVVEEGLYRPWYMHNTSHWIGLDVHDVGPYLVDGVPRPLAEGMCLTVEPGLYFPAADERIPEEFRGIGIRIEDDVLVTAGGHEILTVATPKRVADVEAACAARRVGPPTLDSELASR